MSLKRFKTDKRWWFWISLVLFVVPWFLPILNVEGSPMSPGVCSIILLKHPGHIGGTLTMIGTFTLLIGVPAISIGWVLQYIIVRIRDARRNKTQNPG
jgi:hypothetical protein